MKATVCRVLLFLAFPTTGTPTPHENLSPAPVMCKWEYFKAIVLFVRHKSSPDSTNCAAPVLWKDHLLLIHLALGSCTFKSFLKRSPTVTLPLRARRSSSPIRKQKAVTDETLLMPEGSCFASLQLLSVQSEGKEPVLMGMVFILYTGLFIDHRRREARQEPAPRCCRALISRS